MEGRSVSRVCAGIASLVLGLAVLISAFSLSAAPCWAASAQVVQLNNDGVKSLNAGNFPVAIQKFKDALNHDPTYALARENLAIAYNNYGLQLQNNPAQAIKQFHQALYMNRNNATTLNNLNGIIGLMHKDPRNFKDRIALADTARRSGDFIGAIIEYSEALKIKEDPKISVALGDVYRVQGDVDQAIEAYKSGIRISDTAELELRLGQAYQAKQDLPNAIAAYGKAISLKPDDPDVLDGLVAGWEEALKENPTAPENHIGLGQAFQYRGDFDQAKAEYNQALFFDRNNQVAHKLLADLDNIKRQAFINKHINAGVDLQQRKLYDQAIQEYNEAAKYDPRNPSIAVNIGSAFQMEEDFDKAIAWYQRALALDPNNSAARQGIKASTDLRQEKLLDQALKTAAEMFKLGRFDEAITKYAEVLKANPQNAAIHFDLGAAYQAKKDIDTAIAEYREADSLDPKNAAYKKALEAAYEVKAAPILAQAIEKHKSKDYAAAIDLYQQVLAIKPKDPTLWYDLASAFYSRQDYSKAQEAYGKAMELDPKGQAEDRYFIGRIDENFGKGREALADYQRYLSNLPSGRYRDEVKDRIKALTINPNDTQRIKSEAELAQIQQAGDLFQNAISLQKDKKYDEAVAMYQKAIDLQPKEPSFAYGLGTLFQQKGDIDLAITWYQKAVELDPKNQDYPKVLQTAYDLKAGPLSEQAVKKQTAGDLAGAIDLYKQALALLPRNARLWTNLGSALQQSDDFSSARDAYQKGLDLDPKAEVDNLTFIAAIDENYGQGRKALQGWQKYLSQNPRGQYADLAQNRIRALGKDPTACVKLQTQAERNLAGQAKDAFDQAVKLQEEKKYDEALPLYQKAVQLMPREPAFAYALATLYQAKANFDSAIDWYGKAVQLDPKNSDYKRLLASAYEMKAAPVTDDATKKFQAGDFAAAVALYRQVTDIVPGNARAWTNLGAAQQASDDFQGARFSYQKGLDLDPRGEKDNLYFIAAIDENFGQGTVALGEYRRYLLHSPTGQYATLAKGRVNVLSSNPKATQKLETQADVKAAQAAQDAFDQAVKLQQDGKLDEAIATYQKALGADPQNASYWYSMGTAQQAKNDLDQALTCYLKAESLNSGEVAYKQVIKQVRAAKAAPLLESAFKKQTTKDANGNFDLAGAIADYESALKLDDDPSTHLNLGTAYQGNNDPQKALSEYKKAVAMDPKQVDAYYYLGTVYEALKQPRLAIPQYRKYLQVAPAGSNAAECRSRIKILGGR